MKSNWIKNLAITVAIFTVLAFALFPNTSLDMTKFSTEGLTLDYTVNKDIAMLSDEVKMDDIMANVEVSPLLGKAYNGFKEAVAYKESRGKYHIINDFGYLGKYQFGLETLKLIGIYNADQFLFNPELQEKAFMANLQRNKWVLRKDITRFEGKTINGVKITESGILAAAHLAGPGSVKKFLRSYGNDTFSDAFGSSIRSYMKKFSGYDTSSVIADKKAKVTL
ncbi:peptidoglycan-binding protein LysM [Subsaxibacter sp. CAU 1640]|uniref:peptidoglycan-binding protein LysM n=1 Tax=Subsaxibacter sp. CAU 1640 TaxID=2933271 RepID=UPI002004DD1B|nr:peptidoglycan-binding protein LysM [Subsaxibacter sp. CAU 1640]MCK7590858.1 peptidoglycan-binding protein LysM [Subsaxibacter sp. CAU 1640]